MASAEEYAAWIVKNKDKRGTPEFDTVSKAYELSKSETAKPSKPEGGMLVGLGETALALGTGAIAAPAGGIVGTLAAATPFLREGIGADLSQRIGQAGTYQPRTQSGENITKTIAAPFEWLAGKADTAGQAVADVAGPLAGTATNTAIQSIPLVLGKIIPKGTKAAQAADEAARAQAKVAGSLTDAGTAQAKAAGYVLPPAQVNPSMTNKLLQGLVSEGKLHKAASLRNQPVTNKLVKEAFGIPDDIPLSADALGEIRRAAGANYDAVRNVGTIVADETYMAALKGITADAERIKANFPDRAEPPILKEVKSVGVGQFDSDAAIPVIRDLRERADLAYRGGEKKMGSDFRAVADAMEDLIERNLVTNKAPKDVIKNFREARKTIAQTYTVEKHLANDGNVNAAGLAKELKKKPLEGGIKTAAEFGQQFPKAAQRPEAIGGIGSISPTWAGASAIASAMTQNPAMLGIMAAPPIGRSLMLSRPYQNMLVNPPSYGPSMTNRLGNLITSESANQLLNIGGMAQVDR